MRPGRDADIGINHEKNDEVGERVLFTIILYNDNIKIGHHKLYELHTILRSP